MGLLISKNTMAANAKCLNTDEAANSKSPQNWWYGFRNTNAQMAGNVRKTETAESKKPTADPRICRKSRNHKRSKNKNRQKVPNAVVYRSLSYYDRIRRFETQRFIWQHNNYFQSLAKWQNEMKYRAESGLNPITFNHKVRAGGSCKKKVWHS